MTVDLSMTLGPMDLRSPLVAASGTVGSVVDFVDVTDFSLYGAAVATIPPRIRLALGVEANRGAVPAGRAAVGFLRWALGSSPSWNLALVRVGAGIPAGLFRQPLPVPDPAQGEAQVALHPEVASDDDG